jgi:N-alpha-acetyltransferase 15/16, NatA auxiliary subunit
METKALFANGKNLSDWNTEFLNRHNASASHIQAGLKVRALIGKEAKDMNENDLLATLSLEAVSIREASAGLDLLNEWGSSAEIKDRYRSKAGERWNRASVFATKKIDTQ